MPCAGGGVAVMVAHEAEWISDESMTAVIRRYFPGDGAATAAREPAKKRRKVSEHVAVDAAQADISDRGKFLTLASVDLNILQALLDDTKSAPFTEEEASKVIPVALTSSDKVEGTDQISIFVTTPNKRTELFETTIVSPTLGTDLRILEHAKHLESIYKGGKESGSPAFSQVTIASIRNEDGYDTCCLRVKILWRDTAVVLNKINGSLLNMLWEYLPPEKGRAPKFEEWSPRDFYDNVHIPSKTAALSSEIKNDFLQCTLLPFQRRTVRWLLQKEGAEVLSSGRVVPSTSNDAEGLPHSVRRVRDADGRDCFVSNLLGVVTTDLEAFRTQFNHVKGGILAEEMGLGKTVELMALIGLHRRQLEDGPNSESSDLRSSGATLIITPPAIFQQWVEELRAHAPALNVVHYLGLNSTSKAASSTEMISTLAGADVVLTTYNVLSKEIHVAEERPRRDLRNEKRFEARKSPLVEINWWRVCLDEAQMVESGVSNAAKVARLIPRVNAWALSGTPLKKDVNDLLGLLLFLHYEPFCQSGQIWNRLLGVYKDIFKQMVGKIAIRHSKHNVTEDVRLPPQKRIVITVPFTAIEEQHYSQLFQQMYEDCQLDRNGSPTVDDWDPDNPTITEKMRTWLTRLRQTCLHPEVGGRNRRALGPRAGPLRTVMEVLEVMIDQNDTQVRTAERKLLTSQIQRGQMYENAKCSQDALEIWKRALEYTESMVKESRMQLDQEIEKLRSGPDDRKESIKDEDDDEEDQEANTRIGAFRNRLRGALEIQHICVFFIANAYFQIKSNEEITNPDSDEFTKLEKLETDTYESAKLIRQEMLTEIFQKVNKIMQSVEQKARANSFASIPPMDKLDRRAGIENRKIVDKLQAYCKALDEQGKQFTEWREKMVAFLRQSLIDEEENIELQGDEYEASTKHQDEMYVYMEALRAMYADRHDALTGQFNTLILHEMRAAKKAAERKEGPAPELFLEILATREKVKPGPELGSLRGIISEIRASIIALEWQEGGGSSRAGAELAIVKEILRFAQDVSAEQMKVISALEKEVELFRDTMNTRLEYYKQLQRVSDTVAPYQEERIGMPLDEGEFATKLADERTWEGQVSQLKSKRRYLMHLRTESTSDENARICVICQQTFETGTLTVCGHQFCKDCIRYWWNEHRTCPTCKKYLKISDFHQISYKPKALVAQEESSPARSSDGFELAEKPSIYSDVSTKVLNEIKNIDLDGSFGTKIDTIARHLLWLREHDPGSKSIIFSQYREFLEVLGRAFRQFKIGYSSVDSAGGIQRFKSDPGIECFLLHAKAHASGLNLVNATHVFLCEPLINTAIELQAIARVHRIGQHRSTTVWMYLVRDTVEESIYDISVGRRWAHMQRNNINPKTTSKGKSTPGSSARSGTATPNALLETSIDAANSMELQAAQLSKLLTNGRSGGELVDKDDLWQCLFGKVRRRHTTAAEAQMQEASGEMGRFLREGAAEERRRLARGAFV